MKRLTEADFWARVQRGAEDECWPWLGTMTRAGYGTAAIGGRRTTAHRMAYEFAVGSVPAGMVMMHRCDRPACCNPAHLVPGTQRDNIADMHAKGRQGDCRVFGEEHGRCKVSSAQVSEIRAIYASNAESQEWLARRFGIGQTQVSRIVRGVSRAPN